MNTTILEHVKNIEDYLVTTRRHLHENPELSHEEFETSKYLKEEVRKLGLEIIETKGTGFVAVLDTGREGKTLGLRTDIDALPVEENENNLAGPRVCTSKNDGVMHACGHDGHMAMVLGAAKVLTEMKDSLNGKILFLFEESEELGGGVEPLVEIIKDMNVDAIYGTHLTSFMDVGTISVDRGPVMAGVAGVDFDIIGKGGHGSRPDLSISPIFAAANVLTGLASAWANQIDVTETVTLGLGAINGGVAANVIPNKVNVKGTLRFYNVEEGTRALEIFKKTTELTAQAHNCSVEFLDFTRVASGPVINDEKLAKLAQDSVNDLFPGALKNDVKWFASESFSQYSVVSPILFAFVGIKDEKQGSGAEHHNEYFDLHENSLYYGTAAQVKFACEFLK